MKKIILVGFVVAMFAGATAFPSAADDQVSLDFKNTDIATALKVLSQETGLNIVPGPGVSGKVSASISKVDPMDALRALLGPNGYGYSKNGNNIAVFPEKTGSNMVLRAYHLKYVKAADVKDALQTLLNGPGGEGISFSPKLNVITLQVSIQKIGMLERIISDLDSLPAQVQVEAKIIELRFGNGDDNLPSSTNANWSATSSRNANDYVQLLNTTNANDGAAGPGLYAQILSTNANAYLSAIEKSIGYTLVAAPWMTALNNEEADILIGSKFGYMTSIVNQTSTLQEVNYLEVGTKLTFTPHITDDGYIRMTLNPSVSDGSVVNGLPQENTTETHNEVLVKDGQTVVIGGLTREYKDEVETGVPLLMHIPFLGGFFRQTQLKSEKRDIMVLITPYIVTPEFLEKMKERSDAFTKQYEDTSRQIQLIH